MDNFVELEIIIRDAKNKLGKESREAIGMVDLSSIVLGMAKKYSPDQLEDLVIETELLLCGLTNPDKYPVELETRMKISKEEVLRLVKELDKLVFKKIQEELLKRLDKKDFPTNEKQNTEVQTKLYKQKIESGLGSDYRLKIYEIGQKYRLPIDQQGELEKITNEVILGDTLSGKFESNLRSKINLSGAQLTELINDVNDAVFKKIRLSMRSRWGKGYDEEETNEDIDENIPLPPYAGIPTTHRPIETKKTEVVIPGTTNEVSTIKKDEPVPVQKFFVVNQEYPFVKKEIPEIKEPVPVVKEIVPIPPKLNIVTTQDTPKNEESNPVEKIEVVNNEKEENIALQPKELPYFPKNLFVKKEEETYADSGIEILNSPNQSDESTQAHDPYKEVI